MTREQCGTAWSHVSTRRIPAMMLVTGLLHATRSPHVECWLISMTSAVATLTAGADPLPLSGAWS